MSLTFCLVIIAFTVSEAIINLLCEMVVFLGLEMKGLAISAKEWRGT